MNFANIFRVVNMVAAAFMIIGGVMTCIHGGIKAFDVLYIYIYTLNNIS